MDKLVLTPMEELKSKMPTLSEAELSRINDIEREAFERGSPDFTKWYCMYSALMMKDFNNRRRGIK